MEILTKDDCMHLGRLPLDHILLLDLSDLVECTLLLIRDLEKCTGCPVL